MCCAIVGGAGDVAATVGDEVVEETVLTALESLFVMGAWVVTNNVSPV